MHIAFRADASLEIGTGHVMRCLTLADALRERGAQCRFVCRKHTDNLLEAIRARGFDAHALLAAHGNEPRENNERATIPPHSAWLGTNWKSDARQTLAALGSIQADWLIVDHYALDARWERTLRPACRSIMVIDDLVDRDHECELLLDQNLGRTPTDYARYVPADCKILAGPRYALLRPEFAALRQGSLDRRAKPQMKRLLITMGGVDKDNATGQVLGALKQSPLPKDCRITVVMGPHAPWLEQVKVVATDMPWTTEVLVDVKDMARLMAEIDLAIGAAGGTSWERCCLGLPTLVAVLADNQRPIAEALHNAGAAKVMPSTSLGTELREFLRALTTDISTLGRMNAAANTVTDGQGVTRVITELLGDEDA